MPLRSIVAAALVLTAAPCLRGQERGAFHLHELVRGLTVTPRVLIIGAGPADADADLIAWLARGHSVQTGYLALTRSESRPNFTGVESGPSLGAVHVEETLAARRHDGGEQYFTRAYDFGVARDPAEVFAQWDHRTLLGDMVRIVRSFRPHVIVAHVARDTSSGGAVWQKCHTGPVSQRPTGACTAAASAEHDGQQQATAMLAREAYDDAADTTRFPTRGYGPAWSAQAFYEPGGSVSIDAREFDPLRGTSYADDASDSRSQLRSLGFDAPPWQSSGIVQLRRVASRTAASADGAAGHSIFDGIDTTFARLLTGGPPGAVRLLPQLLATADSARRLLDLEHPIRIAGLLGHAYELASAARKNLRMCGHPSRDLATSAGSRAGACDPRWLDFDASIDLVQQRAADAWLAAAGISVESIAHREFLAAGDTAAVSITIFNHGDSTLRVNDVTVSGAVPVRMAEAIRIEAHSSVRVERSVTTLAYAHPWWIWKRDANFFPPSTTPLDGVARLGFQVMDWSASSITIPEGMRRLSDVTATLTLGGATVSASVGQILYRSADPVLGTSARAVSGVPAVTLGFERALEWARAGRPVKRQLRVALKSYSDRPQSFALRPALSGGAIRLDSLPSVALGPREWRETAVLLRGTPGQMRYELGLNGIAARDTFASGFRTAQYIYLPPLHFFRGSAVYLQGVDVEIPARLAVAYVRGAGDDADVALKQLGIPVWALNNEGLLRFDLGAASTVVIGPDAFLIDPGLAGQRARLNEFVRKGGTLVVMSNQQAATQSGILPFPVSFATPVAERVTRANAPVTAIDPRARVITWPNVIRPPDWSEWTGARALSVPTTADPRYATIVEMHDANQPGNRNTILVGAMGKGRVIYTTLALTQQITNGVPGAMRLFVNLLSAGLSDVREHR